MEAMLPQGIEDRMVGTCPILPGPPILLNSSKSVSAQRYPANLIPLTNDIKDDPIPVGFDIPHPGLTDLALPKPGCEEGGQ